MANFARGLASGFETGVRIGEALRQKRERDRLEEIMKATPQTLQGYSQEDAAQLQALANARDAQGNPYYNVQSTGGLGYQIQPTFQTAEGQAYEPVQMRQPSAVTNFLGQRYGAAGPSAEQMDQARYRAMADVLAETNPAEGLRMRQQMLAEQRASAAEQRAAQLFPGQLRAQEQQFAVGEQGLTKGSLDIEAALDIKKQREAVRDVDKRYTDWFKKQVGDRTPTSDDAIAGLQWRATELFKAGLGDEATKATQQHMTMANQRIELQTRERAAEIPRVIASLAAGNTDAAEEFYRKFVPDGANVKDIKREKDGSYTIKRATLDGSALPDTKIGSLAELDAVIRTFADPAALSNFTQREIENNFRARTLNIQAASAESQREFQQKSLGLREREVERPTAASIVPFLDEKTGKTVLVDVTGLPRKDGVIQTPAGLTAIKGRDTSLSAMDKDILDDAQKDRKWERATLEERARMIKERGGDPEKILGVKGRANPYEDME